MIIPIWSVYPVRQVNTEWIRSGMVCTTCSLDTGRGTYDVVLAPFLNKRTPVKAEICDLQQPLVTTLPISICLKARLFRLAAR